MSTTHDPVVEHEPVADVTPIGLDAASLESTVPEYLLACKRALVDAGLAPEVVSTESRFDGDCSLAVQEVIDPLREHVRAASSLGADRVVGRVETVADEATIVPASETCAEREGVHLAVEGPVAVGDL